MMSVCDRGRSQRTARFSIEGNSHIVANGGGKPPPQANTAGAAEKWAGKHTSQEVKHGHKQGFGRITQPEPRRRAGSGAQEKSPCL